MKPVFEKIIYRDGLSLRVEKIKGSYCEAPWHFHPEYEMVLITKGFGKRYIGDHVEPFEPGDLVFLGHNLPHIWLSDPSFVENKKKNNSEYFVLQFNDEHLPKQILNLPEFNLVRAFLDQSRYGMVISGPIVSQAKELLEKMEKDSGLERYIYFLRLLHIISKHDKTKKLASAGYIQQFAMPANDRLQKVYQYVMDSFRKKVTIHKAASVANMNVTAFCRYFKEKTKRTFTQFIAEIRIGYCCKLIAENRFSMSQAAFESGFNNLSYFNRQFKKILKVTPQEYLKNQTIKQNK